MRFQSFSNVENQVWCAVGEDQSKLTNSYDFRFASLVKPPRARDSEPTIIIGKNREGTMLAGSRKTNNYVSTHLFIMVHGMKGKHIAIP